MKTFTDSPWTVPDVLEALEIETIGSMQHLNRRVMTRRDRSIRYRKDRTELAYTLARLYFNHLLDHQVGAYRWQIASILATKMKSKPWKQFKVCAFAVSPAGDLCFDPDKTLKKRSGVQWLETFYAAVARILDEEAASVLREYSRPDSKPIEPIFNQ